MGLGVTLSPAVPWAMAERTSLPRMWRRRAPGGSKSAGPGLRSQLSVYLAVCDLGQVTGLTCTSS